RRGRTRIRGTLAGAGLRDGSATVGRRAFHMEGVGGDARGGVEGGRPRRRVALLRDLAGRAGEAGRGEGPVGPRDDGGAEGGVGGRVPAHAAWKADRVR